jgi:hypothetical protein
VAVLVARDVGEAGDEARQRAHPLVVVDDEVLAREGQHPFDDHVVDRHRLDERLEVIGGRREPVHAALEQVVEQLVELGVEVLARLRETPVQVVGLEDADLAIEAIEERDVPSLVGDLGAQEHAHVLVGAGAHHRSQLRSDALLADEEGAQPVHPLVALLGVHALVPVDAVLGEVDVLGGPLLALPQLVELPVGQQLCLAAVGGLVERGIARGAEVDALRARWPGLGHDAVPFLGVLGPEPSAWLAGWPAIALDIRLVLGFQHKGTGCRADERAVDAETPDRDMGSALRHPIRYDAARRRLWILGQRCHHGAGGALMAGAAAAGLVATRVGIRAAVTLLTTAGFLMAHDWHDRSVWFALGEQD